MRKESVYAGINGGSTYGSPFPLAFVITHKHFISTAVGRSSAWVSGRPRIKSYLDLGLAEQPCASLTLPLSLSFLICTMGMIMAPTLHMIRGNKPCKSKPEVKAKAPLLSDLTPPMGSAHTGLHVPGADSCLQLSHWPFPLPGRLLPDTYLALSLTCFQGLSNVTF